MTELWLNVYLRKIRIICEELINWINWLVNCFFHRTSKSVNKTRSSENCYFRFETCKLIPFLSIKVTEWLSNSNSPLSEHSKSYFCISIIKPILVTIVPIRLPINHCNSFQSTILINEQQFTSLFDSFPHQCWNT